MCVVCKHKYTYTHTYMHTQLSSVIAPRKCKARKDPTPLGREDYGCPFLKFSRRAFQEQHTDPRPPNIFAWKHFMRNIHFIKERADPGRRFLTQQNPTSNKENTHGRQFCFEFEKEWRISLPEQDCWDVYKFQELRSLSLKTFSIHLLDIWKGDLFHILYPSNSCDQE